MKISKRTIALIIAFFIGVYPGAYLLSMKHVWYVEATIFVGGIVLFSLLLAAIFSVIADNE